MNLPQHLTGQNSQHSSSFMNQESPPEIDGEVVNEKDDLIIVHMSHDEIEELSKIGPIKEEEIDGSIVYDLTGLNEILKEPEIQDIFREALFETEKPQMFSNGGKANPLGIEIDSLRAEGTGEDKELAIITKDMFDMFIEWNGGVIQENPEDGLPEFFKLKNIFKSVVRTVGAGLGPIGGFVSSKLTGKSTKGALKNAGIGLATAALPFIGSAVGGLGGGFGGFGGSAAGGSSSGLLGGLLSGGAKGAGEAGIGSLLSGGAGLMKNLAPLAIAGMGFKGQRDEQKNLKRYEKERKQEAENERKLRGWDEPFNFGSSGTPEENPNQLTEEEIRSGREHSFFRPKTLSQGGAVIGRGKGQDDLIPRNLPNNSYIIDASTVSDIGDGSTHAGFRELDHYFGKRSPIKRSNGGKVKALLSDGEYEVSPNHVKNLGNGSYEKGAKILDKMVKNIRSQKRSNGKKLPPKAKNVGGYLSKMNCT